MIREVIPDEAENSAGTKYVEADSEERAAGGFVLNGVTYDGHEEKVSVTLQDDGHGKITATPTYDGNGASFTNKYEAKGETGMRAWKTLDGGQDFDAGDFSFTLVGVEAGELGSGYTGKAPVRVLDDDDEIETKTELVMTNDEYGTVTFPQLQFDQDDDGKTYVYLVTEQIPDDATNADGVKYSAADATEKAAGGFSLNGISYDDTVMTYTIKVTDNGDGTLSLDSQFNGATLKGEAVDLTVPVFQNTLVPGSLLLWKFVNEGEGSGDPDQLFTFRVSLSYPEGKTMPTEFKYEHLLYSEYTASNSSASAEPSSATSWSLLDGLSDLLSAGASLLAPTVAWADEAEYTITYKVEGGTFSDGTNTNVVKYKRTYSEVGTAISHPSWIDDSGSVIVNTSGNQYGTHYDGTSINGNIYSVMKSEAQSATVSGADMLKVDVWYATDDVSKRYVEVFPGGVTPTTSVYDNGNISGKLGGGNITDTSNSYWGYNANYIYFTHATYYVSGNTVQFLFTDEGVNTTSYTRKEFAGYYATITGYSIQVTEIEEGTDKLPTASEGNTTFNGWYTGIDYALKCDTSALVEDTVVYGYCSPYEHSGVCGTVSWGITTEGELHFWPTDGVEGTFASNIQGARPYTTCSTYYWPWYDYRESVTKVTSEGLIRTGSSIAYMFYEFKNLTEVDGINVWDTSQLSNSNNTAATYGCTGGILGLFYNCRALRELNLSAWDTSHLRGAQATFSNCVSLEYLNISGWDTSKINSMGDLRDMFSICNKLEKVVFGPKLSYHVMYQLPFYTGEYADGKSDGRWVRDDYAYGPYYSYSYYHNSEFTSSTWDGASMAGTWIKYIPSIVATVNFDGNEGSGNMSSLLYPVKTGSSVTLPTSTFYWFDHDFTGWNTKEDGSGRSYEPGTYTVSTASGGWNLYNEDQARNVEAGDTITLYAQWKQQEHTATVQDGSFEVTLKAGEGIRVDDLPAGTTYTIEELTPSGWVIVEKSGDTGQIEADETSEAKFRNKYDTNEASVAINATKLVDEGTEVPANAYQFTLKETTEDVEDPYSETVENTEGGGVAFSVITYDSNDAGTHTYEVSEVIPDGATQAADGTWTYEGVTYDSSKYTVTVNVEDDSEGNLTATATYPAEGGIVFNNTSTPDEPGSLKVTKQVNSTAGVVDDTKEFSFKVEFASGPSFAEITDTQTFTLKAGESKEFTNLAVGTWYRVTETDTPTGYTQTGTVDDGVITAGTSSEVTVTNEYSARGSVNLAAKKVYDGGTLQGGDFTFQLYQAQDADFTLASDASPVDTKTNAADGSVTFDAQSYTSAGTYYYVIREVANSGPDGSVTYATGESHVTVVVEDDGEGKLTPTVTYKETGAGVSDGNVFTNTRKPGSLVITKAVTGTTAVESGKRFSFTVELLDASGNALTKGYTWTRNNANGTTTSNTLTSGGTVELAGGERVTISGLPDGAQYTVTETAADGFDSASDNATGSITGGDTSAAQVDYTNAYHATGEWTPKVSKTYTGSELTQELFTFVLKDADGNVLQTKTNSAADNGETTAEVPFGSISYSVSDLDPTTGKATLTYTIQEVDEGKSGVSYDERTLTVTVALTDKGDGTIEVVPTYDDGSGTTSTDGATFENDWHITLPVTGATGVEWTYVGAAVVLGATAAYTRRRRRRWEAERGGDQR